MVRRKIRKPSDLIDYHKKAAYSSAADQRIRQKFVDCEMTADAKLEAECDELIRKHIAEIQATWTEDDFRDHGWHKRKQLEITQIEVHHHCEDVMIWRNVG